MAPTGPSRNWVFTYNNYTDEIIAKLSVLGIEQGVKYIVFGKEVGETGTPHLQGFVRFSKQVRRTKAVSIIGDCWMEVAVSEVDAIKYAKKDGDFVEVGSVEKKPGRRNDLEEFKNDVKAGTLSLKEVREKHSETYAKYSRFCIEYVQDHRPAKEVEHHPLRNWQKDLNTILNRPANDRTIVFVVDVKGNSGKTWFSHYYRSLHEDVQVMSPGKKADMAYTLMQDIRVLILDAPRSKQSDFIQYDFLEEVKNGYVFSGKYESMMKTLGKVHVVCLMNEDPDFTKLSQDRYHTIRVTESNNIWDIDYKPNENDLP